MLLGACEPTAFMGRWYRPIVKLIDFVSQGCQATPMRSSETRSINDFDSTIDLSSIPVDTSSPVMVTGATGYLGSWVTKGLLDAGITVRAAVRDPQSTNKVAHLNRMAEQLSLIHI